MFEFVLSEYMRNYLKEKNRVFSDFEKATLIWNSPKYSQMEKIISLSELATLTKDHELKEQIIQRIDYEKKAYQKFIENEEEKYVYVVLDDEKNSIGFFSDFRMARECGIEYCAEYELPNFVIEKQLIFGEKTKNDVIFPWISKYNLLKIDRYEGNCYEGRENVWAKYDKDGELFDLYSNEMSDDENDKVDSQNRERFEYHFFKLPCGFREGEIVRIIQEDKYAVVDSGEEHWNEYMKKIDEDPLYYDYSDIQIIVYVLKEDGHWSHEHVNPLYLEPDIPEIQDNNDKSNTYRDALIALSQYFKEKTKENNIKAVEASRKYANICAGKINWSRILYETDDVEKLIF